MKQKVNTWEFGHFSIRHWAKCLKNVDGCICQPLPHKRGSSAWGSCIFGQCWLGQDCKCSQNIVSPSAAPSSEHLAVISDR